VRPQDHATPNTYERAIAAAIEEIPDNADLKQMGVLLVDPSCSRYDELAADAPACVTDDGICVAVRPIEQMPERTRGLFRAMHYAFAAQPPVPASAPWGAAGCPLPWVAIVVIRGSAWLARVVMLTRSVA
jgi:hypothetical protein